MTAPPELRDYQLSTRAEVASLIRQGFKRILVCMPTGAGKTTLFSSMVQSAAAKQSRSLVIAHRRELIDQAHARLFLFGVNAGKIMGGKKHSYKGDRTNVASIQTLSRRDMPPADHIVVDEAHHVTEGNQYGKLIEEYPNAVIIGYTASPQRLDGKPLGFFFEVLVESVSVAELIAEGHLVQPRYFCAPESISTKGVGKVAGDFNSAELFNNADKPQLYLGVYTNWKRLASKLKTVIFCVNVEHSQKTCAEFQSHGVAAGHLDAKTPEEERKQILADFASGVIQVLCNVGILTEGYDLPAIGCVVLNRATASLSLYLQMGGRGLRPYTDPTTGRMKSTCLILDHGENVKRHHYLETEREWSLKPKKKKPGAAPVKECKFELPEHMAYFPGEQCGCLNRASATHCVECGAPFPPPKKEAPKHTELVEVFPPHLAGKAWHELATAKEIWEFQHASRTKAGKPYAVGWAIVQLWGLVDRTDWDPEIVFGDYADLAGYRHSWVYRCLDERAKAQAKTNATAIA